MTCEVDYTLLPAEFQDLDEWDRQCVTGDFLVKWSYGGLHGKFLSKGSNEYWLLEGNGSCDCNRVAHCKGLTPKKFPELYHIKGDMYGDGSGPVDETHVRCGDKIELVSMKYMGPSK